MITPLGNHQDSVLINNHEKGCDTLLSPDNFSKLKLYGKLIFKVLAVFSIILSPAIFRYPNLPKAVMYSWFRDLGKLSIEYQTRDLFEIHGTHFVVKYQSADQAIAPLVLETVEGAYGPVTKDLNYVPADGKIPIVIYPTKEELGRSFGWPASESAMGVYYSGAIRVLSPREWVAAENEDVFNKTFRDAGPMAHEFTHLVVDYMTRGNYPRWFTEGLALYEENKLTGFKLTDMEGNLNQPLYNLKEMGRSFDNLPNQSLAYRQSFAAIVFIIDNYGRTSLDEILGYLAQGKTLNQTLNLALGVNYEKFNDKYKQWVKENMNKL